MGVARVARRIVLAVICGLVALSGQARSKFQGYVEQGGQRHQNAGIFAITRAGAVQSNPYSQQSYPNATVTVWTANTTTPATIYSTTEGTVLANPFTASSTGYFAFFGDAVTYDIHFSGGGITTPFTWSGVAATQAATTVTDCYGYGATGGGIIDETSALTACFAAGAGGLINISTGTHLVTGAGALFTVSAHGTHIRGAGERATIVKLSPTAAATVFTFSATSPPLYGCSIDGISFTSTNTTFTKTAISLIDTSGMSVTHCSVGPIGSWHDAGNTSIGIRIAGRDLGIIRDNTLGVAADRSLVGVTNPNAPGLDLDHWTIENNLFESNGNPGIELINVASTNSAIHNNNVSIGTYGIYRHGTSTGQSYGTSIINFRFEQGTSAAGYAIDWEDTGQPTYGLDVSNASAGVPGRGYKFRLIDKLTLRNSTYLGSGIALDVDTTNQMILSQNFWQTGTTFSIANMSRLFQYGYSVPQPTPGSAYEFWTATSATGGQALSLLNEFRLTDVNDLVGNNGASVVILPGLSGQNVRGRIGLTFYGGGDGVCEYGFTPTAIYLIGPAGGNCTAGIPGANHVGIAFSGPGAISLFNDYAATIHYTLSTQLFFP